MTTAPRLHHVPVALALGCSPGDHREPAPEPADSLAFEQPPEETDETGTAVEGCTVFEIIDHEPLSGRSSSTIDGCQEHRWLLPSVAELESIDIVGGIGDEIEAELLWPVSDEFTECASPLASVLGFDTVSLDGVRAGELELRVRNLTDAPTHYDVYRRCPGIECDGPLRFPVAMVPDWGPLGNFSADATQWGQDFPSPVEFVDLPQFMIPEERARLLGDQVDPIRRSHCARKVNLVAFGQGAIDSRAFISADGGPEVVASLLSVGAPHRGIVFESNWLLVLLAELSLSANEQSVFASLHALTPEAMESFNEHHPYREDGVDYSFHVSTVSACRTEWAWMPPWWPKTDNDCLVTVDSGRWGDDLEISDALTHTAQLGRDPCPFSWLHGPEICSIGTHQPHRQLYDNLMNALEERGH